MKSFYQFYEQAVAAAPAPTPAAAPKVAKAQPKSKPKVTDPSSGVDIDDDGRWKGDIVDQGKVIKPEQKIKVKDGKKGPDPDLPSGEANPNKKKKDYGDIASHDKPFSKYPAAGGSDKWPGIPGDKMDLLYPSNKPTINLPIRPYGIKQASGSKDTQIAGVGPYGPGNPAPTNYGDPNKIKWPRDKYPNKKAPPGPGVRNV